MAETVGNETAGAGTAGTGTAGEFRLETARLVLRDWRAGDREEFRRLTNTPAVMRWLGGVADEATAAAALDRIEGYRRDHGHTFWICERKADGGHLSAGMLGFCGLKRANIEGEKVFGMVEVGWRLREDAWGRGYAKEAAAASLRAGFGQFAADEIVALTVPGNTSSWGLMERLGMRRRKDLEFDHPAFEEGHPLRRHIVYSITRSDWNQGEFHAS